ncbi:lipoprotein insertase outer membrane protein LolB [Oceanicoccus sp. KOV_DT_Chl]|uniref:lipoprotein insertase outer membrane protein LolB n=1 Tax=Oceanicoccus sp. KOV_DT_Chl TaxID=1904639 RepID=UPI001358D760|nr:lipoprotein insertase outer membrane protein LolB [Oceanicoccus sp. KOV_DT_Chl]
MLALATIRHRIVLAACLLLSACSQLPTVTPAGQQALAANSHIQHWQISGKIGWRHGDQAESAYLNWHQCGQQFEIRLTGPLGQGAAKLFGDASITSLQTSDGQIFTAASPEQLLFEQLGWTLPLSQLHFWVRGIPAPTSPFQPGNTDYDFEQQQWQLNFPRFTAIDSYQLPTKLKATHLDPIPFSGASPLSVTLIIKDWQLPSQCQL